MQTNNKNVYMHLLFWRQDKILGEAEKATEREGRAKDTRMKERQGYFPIFYLVDGTGVESGLLWEGGSISLAGGGVAGSASEAGLFLADAKAGGGVAGTGGLNLSKGNTFLSRSPRFPSRANLATTCAFVCLAVFTCLVASFSLGRNFSSK